jgi:hypothetical protein
MEFQIKEYIKFKVLKPVKSLQVTATKYINN